MECANCHKEISTEAWRCPNCGEPTQKYKDYIEKEEKKDSKVDNKKKFIIFVSASVLLIIILITIFSLINRRPSEPSVSGNVDSSILASNSVSDTENYETENSETTALYSNKIQEGQYKVGADIKQGMYMVFALEGKNGYVCVSSDSNANDIIFNDNFSNNVIISISNGQYIELNRCYAVPYNDNIKVSTSGEGYFKAGVHIKAGEYKLTANEGKTGYYCVYDGPLSGKEKIVSNNNFKGNSYVTVKSGQYLVLTRCSMTYVGAGNSSTSNNSTAVVASTTKPSTTKPSTTKPSTTASSGSTSSFPTDVKTYPGYSCAPDFGAILGVPYSTTYKSPNANMTHYVYSKSAILETGISNPLSHYEYVLFRCGYAKMESTYINGVKYAVYGHGPSSTIIEIGYLEQFDSVDIVVYQ